MTSSTTDVTRRRLWLSAAALAILLLILIVPRLASARGTFMSSWESAYPSSLSGDNVINGTGGSCQLCHRDSNGGNGWNAYGWAIWLEMDGGSSFAAAIIAIESSDSDTDPTGSSNLVEINADTQPGWTDGPNNTIYLKDLSTTTGQMPPAGILGDLDPVNDPPAAVADTYSTSENGTLNVVAPGVLGNDSDPEGDPMTAVLVSGVSNGTLTLNTNGSFDYTPTAGFSGSDSFLYKANDGASDSNTVTVTITVNPINDPPVAVADSYATDEDVALNVAAPGVLGNDSDPEGDPITAVLASDVTSGSLTLNANGSFDYTPTAGFSGSDSFTYRANDGALSSNLVTVTITVNPINDPPVAVADSYATDEDVSLNVAAPGVLGNDSDPEGDPMTAVLVSGVSNGTLTLNTNGSFDYTPAANFNGSDSFTYRASAAGQTSAITTVTITVNPINDPPVAVADSYATDEDVALNVAAPGVLGNDSDPEGDPITAVLASDVTSGSLTLNANGSFDYTPTAGFSGSDSFTYRANDGALSSNLVTVTITVNPINDPPVAVADSYATDEDVALNVAAPGVLGNDSDPEGDPMTAVLVSGVSNGSLTLNTNGSFDYTPAANFNGSDSFTYRASDGSQTSAITTVTITVNPINDPPVATGDAYTTNQDTTLNVAAPGVLNNDTDPDGNPLTAVLAADVGSGSLTLNSDGSFVYTPNAGFSGSDSFTYVANDGALDSSTATVNITVNAGAAPIANDDSYTTGEDVPLNVAAPGVLGNDVGSGTLTAVLNSDVSNGSLTLNSNGSFDYTPAANFNGSDSFTYVVSDGVTDSNVATVSITVTAVNDVPVVVDDSYATDEDATLTVAALAGVLSNDSDVEGDPLTAVLASDVTSGVLNLNTDGSFGYVPNANFNGSDSFTYEARDGNGGAAPGTVTITVNPINDPPVAADDSYTINEDTVLVQLAPGVIGNDTDLDGDALTAVLVSDVTSGALTLNTDGSFSYIPVANFSGSVSFTYLANDGSVDSNTVTATITVTAVNDPPVVVDDSYATDEDATLTVAALAGVLSNDSDVEGDPLTAVLASDVTSGVLNLNTDGSFGYVPNANFNGSDSFTYEARDGNGGATPGTVTITVNPINDPPVAADDSYTINEDTVLVQLAPGVIGNDTDLDGDALTAVLVSDVTSGALTLNTDGSFSYIPVANFSGSVSFTYLANDGSVDSNTVTATITVTAVNDPPVADPGGPYSGVASAAVAFDGSASFDPDGSISTYVWDFGDGAIASGSTASHTYLAGGTFTVTLTVTDNGGATGSATTTATIQAPPVADAGGPYTGVIGTAVSLTGAASTDSDGSIVSYAWDFGDSTTGTGSTTSHNYAAAGTYTITLTVTDNDGLSSTDTAIATIGSLDGSAIYAAECAGCHGANGEGGIGPSLQASTLSLSQIVSIVTNGQGAMPGFSSTLTSAQIDSVSTHALGLQVTGATTTTTTTVPPGATGSQIYAAECAACHGANGEGGIGPSLQASTLSLSQIVSIVTNGQGAMPGFSPKLTSAQIGSVGSHALNLQVAGATTTTTTSVPPGATGSQIYAAECAACHGANGEGGIGPSLQASTLSLSQIVSIVTNGQGAMPGFSPKLTSAQIGSVGSHALNLQVAGATTTTTTSVPPGATGSQIYAAECAACHGANGEGGIGPSLQASTLSLSQIVSIVTNGQGAMPGFSPKLTSAQIGSVGSHALNLQVAGATTTTSTTVPPGATGSQIYAAECAACHGSSGGGGIGPSLQASTLSTSQIASIVANGQGAMPGFSSKLTSSQIQSVSSHAAGLQVAGATTTTTTLPTTANGSEIYAAKCAACHGASGEGGIGPSLQAITLSSSRIASIVRNGEDAMPAITDLSSEQIQAVAAYAVGLQVTGATTTSTTTLAAGAGGADIYAANCAACHGADLTGGIGPSLIDTPLDVDAVIAIVADGKNTMPPFNSSLSASQIEDVSAFVVNYDPSAVTSTTQPNGDAGATIEAANSAPPVAAEIPDEGFVVNALLMAFLVAGGALMGGVATYLWRTRAVA